MTIFVVAGGLCAVLFGFWIGSTYTRFVFRSEFRSLTRRVSEYTSERADQALLDTVKGIDRRKPW